MRTERTAQLKDLALGLSATAIAIAYLIATYEIGATASESGTDTDVGLTLFPYVLGVALLVLGVLFTVLRIPGVRRTDPVPPANGPEPEAEEPEPDAGPAQGAGAAQEHGEPLGWRQYRHVLMLAAAVAFVILMTILGFLPAMLLFVAAGVFIVSAPGTYRGLRLLSPLLYGGVTALVCDLIFSEVLGMALPPGVLGIGGI